MEDTGTPTTHLVSAAQAGDRRALEGLFARYLPRVRRIVALRLGYRLADLAEYEDLVQDALLNVFDRLQSYRKRSEARFRHWLAVCVTNSVRAHIRGARTKKRSRMLPSYPYPSADLAALVAPARSADPRALAECSELADRLEAALLGLHERYREAIILSRLCGMSAQEVAAALSLPSVESARKVVSRALARLRDASGLNETQ